VLEGQGKGPRRIKLAVVQDIADKQVTEYLQRAYQAAA